MYSSLIFRGRRLVELQKWRNLNVTVKIASCFFNSFSSADVSPPQDGKTFGVSYLVDSLGFTRKRAESISMKVGSEGNPDSVLDLLRSHGFTDSHIASIITTYPRLLMLDAEKSLTPKLQFLQSRGASTSELTKILSGFPQILGMRWHKAISRHYDFLKEFIEADGSEFSCQFLSVLKMKLVENASVLSILSSYGFTDSQISSIITAYPGVLMLDADKSLAPNLKFLQSRGASSSDLTEILTRVPKILGMKGKLTVSRHYDCVKYFIESRKSSKGYKKSSLPHVDNKVENVLVLIQLGVPQNLLFPLLISDKRICSGKEKFEKSLKKVVEMGFDPSTPKFVIALIVVYKSSDKAIEDKVNLYKRLGFDVEDVRAVFKKMNTKLVADSHHTC